MKSSHKSHRRPVMAVASGGGHWIELTRLIPAWHGQAVVYVTTDPGYAKDVPGQRLFVVPDANRWDKIGMIRLAICMLWIVMRTRPGVVISTGAAVGYLAVRFARWFGARTVWVDSIANVEELSLSGQMAGKVVDLWLTQWPDLATDGGPQYAGAVLE